MVTIRPLLPGDIPAGAHLAARAFRNNNAMVAILERSEAQREHLLSQFGRTLFSVHVKHGQCWALFEDEVIRAAMLTLGPGQYPLPWTAEARLGLTSLRLGGWSTTQRFSSIDRFVKTLHPRRPHHYLYMLATDPDHQRRGFGSRLLETLARAVGPTEIYLETDEPHNLPFYERCGYRVEGQAPSPIGAPPFPIWFLSRPKVDPK